MKKQRNSVIDEDGFIDMGYLVDSRGVLVQIQTSCVFDWQDLLILPYQVKHEDIDHYPHNGHTCGSSGGSRLSLLLGLEFQCRGEWKYDSIHGVRGFDNSPVYRSCRY